MTPVGVALIVGGITTLIVFRRFLFEASGPERRRGTTERGRQRRDSRRAPADPGPRSRRRGATRSRRDSATPPPPERAASASAERALPPPPERAASASPERALPPPAKPAASAPTVRGATPPQVTRMAEVNKQMRPLDAAPARLPDLDTLHAPGRIVRERLNVERSTGSRVERTAESRERWPLLNTRSEADSAAAGRPWRPEEGQAAPKQDQPARYGDRVDGWVRPEYRDEPATGDYWMPAPDAGYGWPVPVERLPQVPPPVAPARAEAESEPTAIVPQWPPLPQRPAPGASEWRPRPTEPMSPLPVRTPAQPPPEMGPVAGRAESVEGPIWTVPDLPEAALPDLSWAPHRDENPRRQLTMRRQRAGEPRPAPAKQERPRPRPSPRPRPGADPADPADPRSTVYRSRHAAEPT